MRRAKPGASPCLVASETPFSPSSPDVKQAPALPDKAMNNFELTPQMIAFLNSCVGLDQRGSPASAAKRRQFFGAWASEAPFLAAGLDTGLSRNEPRYREVDNFLSAQLNASSWWTIDVWGRSLERTVNPGATIQAIGPQQADALPLRISRMKARLYFEDLSPSRAVDFDIGAGVTLSVRAMGVRVTLLVPAESNGDANLPQPVSTSNLLVPSTSRGMVEVATTQGPVAFLPTLTGTGVPGPGLNRTLVLDDVVYGTVQPGWNPKGTLGARLTQRVAWAPNPEGVPFRVALRVPDGARRVTITTNDGATPPWNFLNQAFEAGILPAPGVLVESIETITWGNGPTPNSVTVPVPANAGALAGYFIAPPVAPGQGEVIWDLEF